jgi:hypothetical protein
MKRIHLLFALATMASILFTGCGKTEPAASGSPSGDQASQATTNSGSATTTIASGGQNAGDKGKEIGSVYEAYLSPWQEGGEEKDTPKSTPSQFKATQPSRLRKDRPDHGHGKIKFTKDLSKAIIEVEVGDVTIENVNMFHIHCGRPSQLGPIMVDFGLITDIRANFEDDGVLTLEVTDADIEAEIAAGSGIVGAFTAGCPIIPGGKDKFTTVGGMEYLARAGELYFNLHTYGETYYGDIRGQVRPAADDAEDPIVWKVAPEDAPAPSANSEGHSHH